ncbi:ribonuclease III [Erysipelothrix urinaevulpis]|uniref:ribonuclease III n=1 Tax=Erysipelothrix urinaevulpis TaxID=2683717 RepID=UPI0013591138|nr:ribonuclease III [Erysipelothrix urinaevulpis]
MSVFKLLDRIKVPYKDKTLIRQAFVHASYVNESKEQLEDNERLEFMGDAVLQILVSKRLYSHEDHLNEGEMTLYRAKLVCEEALMNYSLQLGLNEFLLLGMGEEKNGGRKRASIIADLFESFIGAVYLDTGLESVEKILDIVLEEEMANLEALSITDYKTKLQEYIQSDSRRSVSYEVKNVTGPSNAPVFEVLVKVDGLVFGQGSGTSKKRAEQKAAQDAFKKLVK